MKRTTPRSRAAQVPSARANARHEAAHAVAGVRLGLPLASTEILGGSREGGDWLLGNMTLPPGTIVVSMGYTSLVKGSVKGWFKALPDPGARANLEAFAAQCAAGIIAERARRARDDDIAHRSDVQEIVQVAGYLDIGKSTKEEPVVAFIDASIERAAEVLLLQDEGAAWLFVADVLRSRKTLTGDEVRNLIAQSDEKRAKTSPSPRRKL